MYWQSFLRAVGFRRSFRRSAGNSWSSLILAAGLGTISGHYIFKAPIEEFWSEENKELREKKFGGAEKD